jgi:hypothetical protein
MVPRSVALVFLSAATVLSTVIFFEFPLSNAFSNHRQHTRRIQRNSYLDQHQLQSSPVGNDNTNVAVTPAVNLSLRDEAETLKAKAERLRQEIELQQQERQTPKSSGDSTEIVSSGLAAGKIGNAVISMPWSLDSSADHEDGEEFRLYVDIGREDGTWMDARWGASGNRIPFTLDIKLLANQLAEEDVASKMVKDNTMGKSSKVLKLKTAPFARLRDGFDRMQCHGGAYRMDLAKNGQYTIRMMVEVEGTKADQNFVYGDVSIPKGCLYFSLPCFGGRINQLSTKEGPVTVRQVGWHTGWRREESRILGMFRAKSMTEAKRKDLY